MTYAPHYPRRRAAPITVTDWLINFLVMGMLAAVSMTIYSIYSDRVYHWLQSGVDRLIH